MRALRSAAAGFLLFFAVGLVLSWPALRWPMVYDDLHLLRPFTPQERAQAWRGSWDPDGIEHAGLRPLTLAFNDARYRLFGEDVAAHRVFLVSLFALYVTVLVRLSSALGVPEPAAIGSGLLLLCSRYSVYHYVWLTDGVYLLQGLLVAIAALALVAGVRGRSGTRLAAALAAFAAAVLVREDTLALVPVLLLLGFVAAPRERRLLALFAAALLATSAVLFFYRLRAVPEAAPPGLDAGSLAVAVARALNLVGPESFDRASRILAWTWTGAPVLVAAGLIANRHAVDVRTPFVFLAAAVLACTPALTFRRDNLLFLPVSFAAFYYGSGLWGLARGRPPLRVAAALLFASGVLGGACVSRVFALNFHADSARAVRWNAQMLHGPNAERATIPPDRRAAVARQLAAHGVTSAADLRPLGARIGRARAEGPFRPGAPGTLFFPPLPEGDF